MTKTSVLVVLLLAAGGVAHAGGQTGSFGVGVEGDLNGLTGLSGSYDGGKFDADAFLGYLRVDVGMGNTDSLTELGGRFFYHIHSTAMSDFGIGGALALASVPTMPRTTPIFLEPGFQIRLFLASNVALSFMGGLSIGVGDAKTTQLAGQTIGGPVIDFGGGVVSLAGAAGIHYYFF